MSNARFVRIGHFIIYKSKYMESNKLSLYEKIQAVLDYISGMTDVYALDLYRKIKGNSLPAV